VGVATPEVYGTSLAEEAPEKAADWEDAVGLGVAIVMLGFKTLSVDLAPMIGNSSKINILVNDMDDTVGHQDVGHDDLCRVDECGPVDHGDGDVPAAHGLEHGVVHQHGRVINGAVADVVSQDAGELLGRHIRQSRTDGLESGVVGREDCDITCRIEGLHQLRVHESSREGGQVGGDGGRGDVLRYGEDTVNDMDHTAGEVHVLQVVSVNAIGR